MSKDKRRALQVTDIVTGKTEIGSFNTVLKQYPNGIKHTHFFHEKYITGWEETYTKTSCLKPKKSTNDTIDIELTELEEKFTLEELERKAKHKENSRMQRICKVRAKVFDYAIMNLWDYFVTLTFDQKKVDRSCLKTLKTETRKFLKAYQRVNSEFKYLLIFEKHKDGINYHVHGLFKNLNEKDLEHARYPNGKLYKIKTLEGMTQTYNFTAWKFGFTSLMKVYGNKESITKYMTKYITKDLEYIKGQINYLNSRNLDVPEIERKYMTTEEFKKISNGNQLDLIENQYNLQFFQPIDFEQQE